jgi:hypothetical protein
MNTAHNAHELIAKELLMKFTSFLLSPITMLALAGCAQTPSAPVASERYRCELGIEFTARFQDNSVALATTRGYELLFRDAKPLPDSPKPHEYRNARMSAEFKMGANSREALLRYPLLPLAVRCVRDQ